MQNRRSRHTYFGLMTLITVALIVACSVLLWQNQSMAQHNRELIIMNDSIMSANIELKTKSQPKASEYTGSFTQRR